MTRVTADEIIVDSGTAGAGGGAAGPARAGRSVPRQEVLAHQPGHGHQPAAAGPSRPDRAGRGDHRRRRRDGRRGAGARRERDGGVHAVVRAQLRGRHRALGAAGQGRRLLVDPRPGAGAPRPRHQARPGRDHSRDPERLRRGPRRSRRARHRPDRRARQAGRHPRRQDHAEGRDGAVAGREAADGDLRREGQGREGLLAQGPARNEGHRDRRQDLQPGRRPGGGEGPRRANRRGPADRARGKDPDQRGDDRGAQRAAHRAGRRPDAPGRHGRGVLPRGHHAYGGHAQGRGPRRRRPEDAPARPTRAPTSGCARPSTRPRAERARVEERAEDQIDKILQPDELPPGVIQLVKVYLGEKRKISVGDKMAGRHGNKGIVARIVPEEDMPFLPDGRPVDIVLNPLGVPSRMNVGQILETHLGWCASLLGFKAKTPVFRGADEGEIGLLMRLAGLKWAGEALNLARHAPTPEPAAVKALVDDLKRIGVEPGAWPWPASPTCPAPRRRAATKKLYAEFKAFLGTAAAELGERALEAGRNEIAYHEARIGDAEGARKKTLEAGLKALKEGSPKTPEAALVASRLPELVEVLEGKGDAAQVSAAADALMRAAGLTPTGKVRLHDGRTGQPFESDVTVGEIYMLKLSHLVDDKIHARSIGPYSLVTQQPLAGKAQFGGQRFGEMEAGPRGHGAAHLLQEMLTVKSDDVNGRSKVYEAIVKGQTSPSREFRSPSTCSVKELQALGLRVTSEPQLKARSDGQR